MLIFLWISIVLISSVSSSPTDGQNQIFSETFQSSSLNTSLWNSGYPWGSFYNHRANTIPRQLRITQDHLLNITATRERSITQGLWTEFGPIDLDFSSGAVNSNGKFCIRNGYVEVNVRVPEIESTWPMIFLVPDGQGQVPMLTMMEVFNGRSSYSYGFKYTNDQSSVEEFHQTTTNKPTSDAFHRFGIDWGYDVITWYYDGNMVDTITLSQEIAKLDQMCLVISLGVGGKAQEAPIGARDYPAIMSVQSINVWQPKYDGFFKFQNVQTGFLMEIDSASHDVDARVLQWPDNGGAWQIWHVQYAGHGQYRFIVAHSRLALDVANWETQDGAKLLQWHYHTGTNQLWKIVEVEGESDVVQLVSVHSFFDSEQGKLVSVPASNTAAAAQLEIWSDLKSDLQKWRMIRV